MVLLGDAFGTAVGDIQKVVTRFRELTLLELSVSPPFPFAFVVVATLTAVALPPLYRYYHDQGWRIPLWHLFAFNAWLALACLLGVEHMNERHLVDRKYWLYVTDSCSAQISQCRPIWIGSNRI